MAEYDGAWLAHSELHVSLSGWENEKVADIVHAFIIVQNSREGDSFREYLRFSKAVSF